MKRIASLIALPLMLSLAACGGEADTGAKGAASGEPIAAIPAPAGAREESLRLLLQTAADSGVSRVATKPDGDGERWLGQAWRWYRA